MEEVEYMANGGGTDDDASSEDGPNEDEGAAG